MLNYKKKQQISREYVILGILKNFFLKDFPRVGNNSAQSAIPPLC